MKKYLSGLLLLLLLTACGTSETTQNDLDTGAIANNPSPTEATNSEEEAPVAAEIVVKDEEAEEDTAVTATDAPTYQPASDIATAAELRDSDQTKGAEEPIIAIIEYSNFQCPDCAGIASVFERLVNAYPDQIQVTYRHFPLTQIYDKASKAAEASEAAGAQGQFWEYHDALYENQAEWADLSPADFNQFLIDMADNLGLDSDQFTADLDSGKYAAYVQAQEEEANNLQLPGTPAIILNGQFLPQAPPDFDIWANFIESQIAVASMEDRQYDAPPPEIIDPDKSYFATIELDTGEEIVLELFAKSAPITVNNFVFLAQNGWYDDILFHRVIPGFMAQAGDPSGTGAGGPGYTIPDEIDPELEFVGEGVLAMANAGPDTGGSQFFITYDSTEYLNGLHTIFGQVTEGMDAAKNIAPRDPQNPDAEGTRIVTITIEEK